MYDRPCIETAMSTPTKEALKLIVLFAKENNESQTEIAQRMDIFQELHNLKLNNTDTIEIYEMNGNPCEYAKELGLCREEKCQMKKTVIDKMISNIDKSSIALNLTTAVLAFKINNIAQKLDLKKIYVMKKKEGEITASVDVTPLYQMYIGTYFEPPKTMIKAEDATRFVEYLKENARKINGMTDDELIESLLFEYLYNVRYYKIEQLGKNTLSGRAFVNQKETYIMISAQDLYKYIKDDSNYSNRQIINAIQFCIIKDEKNSSVTHVVYVKNKNGEGKGHRFLKLSINAIEHMFAMKNKNFEIMYSELENNEFEKAMNSLNEEETEKENGEKE